MNLSKSDVEIVWAAMHAMVSENHAPQDCLTEEQWDRAEELLGEMDAIVDGFDFGVDDEEDADV